MQKRVTAGRSTTPLAPPPGVPTRGMNPEETEQLLRRFRNPASRILRFFGILIGLGAAILALTDLAGFPYDPNVIPWEVLITGVFAVGCTAGGTGMIRDIRPAVEAGLVFDHTGPVVLSEQWPPGFSEARFGPVLLQIPRSHTGNLVPGPAQRICVAVGLRPAKNNRVPGLLPDRGLWLSLNGLPLSAPTLVHLRSIGNEAPQGWTGNPPPTTAPPAMSPILAAAAPAPAGAGSSYCDRCGQANASDFRFCRKCGAPRTLVGTSP